MVGAFNEAIRTISAHPEDKMPSSTLAEYSRRDLEAEPYWNPRLSKRIAIGQISLLYVQQFVSPKVSW